MRTRPSLFASKLVARALLVLALSAPVASLAAQDSSRVMPPAAERIPYISSVAFNPVLGIPYDIASVEFESAVASGVTLGGTASYTHGNGWAAGVSNPSRRIWKTVEMEAHYYPGEVVLRGASFGLGLGYTSFRYDTTIGASTHAMMSAPTIGVLANYNYLVGERQRFLVGVGVGGKRILATDDKRAPLALPRAYLTTRLVLGLAF